MTNLMTMEKVLNRAWHKTLELIDKEEKFLEKHPENNIALHRLAVLKEEESQLHNMIVAEERKQEILKNKK